MIKCRRVERDEIITRTLEKSPNTAQFFEVGERKLGGGTRRGKLGILNFCLFNCLPLHFYIIVNASTIHLFISLLPSSYFGSEFFT